MSADKKDTSSSHNHSEVVLIIWRKKTHTRADYQKKSSQEKNQQGEEKLTSGVAVVVGWGAACWGPFGAGRGGAAVELESDVDLELFSF